MCPKNIHQSSAKPGLKRKAACRVHLPIHTDHEAQDLSLEDFGVRLIRSAHLLLARANPFTNLHILFEVPPLPLKKN